MAKALVITSVASMVQQFLLPSIILLQKIGYEVQVACNFKKGSTCSREQIEELKEILKSYGVEFHQIDFERDVLQLSQNLYAYRQLANVISKGGFSLIHCHSPIGGFLGRMAARKLRKNGTKVFYTAHGFHFYKGAPLKNWLCYYPIEKFTSYFTDVLIVINQEDYIFAKKKLHAKKIEYVPGVGIDLSKFANISIDRVAKRKEIGISENAILLVSVGELIPRKNHKIILKSLAQIPDENIHYIIVGKGALLDELQVFAEKLGIRSRVHFLGYRKDVAELYKASDICCFPSFQEGLPVALMEAMACGLPVVCSRIRGNTDLIDLSGGELFHPGKVEECHQAIINLMNNDMIRMGKANQRCVQNYAMEIIVEKMKEIYENE